MNKYQSAMEKIVVTPQMEERILLNISKIKGTGVETKKQLNLKWNRYIGIVASCCAVIFCVIFIYPSIINLNRGENLVKHPQKVITAESSGNSAETAVQSKKQQEQTPESVVSTPETAVQSEKHKEQAPKSDDSSSKTVSLPETARKQSPKSVGNSAGSTAQPDKQNGQSPASAANSAEPTGQSGEQPVLVCNPMEEIKGVDELKKAVAFELFIPEKLPAGYKIDSTSVISKKIAQIIYTNGDDRITYRVSKGSEDISGDYTTYNEAEVIKVNDIEAALKGNNSLINLATWVKDGCAYALSLSPGIDKMTVVSIINSMKKA
jgi:hypothetical protein